MRAPLPSTSETTSSTSTSKLLISVPWTTVRAVHLSPRWTSCRRVIGSLAEAAGADRAARPTMHARTRRTLRHCSGPRRLTHRLGCATMGSVAVVSDTCHYLPRRLVAARAIHEVSLYVHWDGREDREADLPDFDAYYEHLRTAKDLPTTSQPSIGDFLAVYEPLLADGRDIVSIHLSGAISGTMASAEQAKEQLAGQGGERIHVVDSRS